MHASRPRAKLGRVSLRVRASWCAAVLLGACGTSRDHVLDSPDAGLQLRQIQTRAFDSTDVNQTLRIVIATLQDLDFVIDKADGDLGTVSGTKLDNYQLRMTVMVRKRNEKQLLVRANAQLNISPVRDPLPYQQFFAALEKSMFLTAHRVD